MTKEFRTGSGRIYARVTTDAKRSIVSDTWYGSFETQENFREVLFYVLNQIEKYCLSKWLADLRELEGYFDESSEWISKEVMPSAIQAGLLKEAIVLPKNVFARLSTKETILMIKDFELRQFHNYAQAEKWLSETTEPFLNNQYADTR